MNPLPPPKNVPNLRHEKKNSEMNPSLLLGQNP